MKTVKIISFTRRPFDMVSRDQSVARAQIQADEDTKMLDALDALANDPPCAVCKAERTSEGAKAGCDHCIVREVMIS